jgi:tRNA threonylcarbamoyladenosine biosynthesis protein TsaB
MLILTIRTDKPEAELGLYEDATRLNYIVWPAHRQLAETIHLKIKGLLDAKRKKLEEITAIVYFKGPGSFTGLRIGSSVANALAEAGHVKVVGSKNENWIDAGIKRLMSNQNDKVATPEYGAEPHITSPLK